MLSEPQYHSVDGETAVLANEIANLGLEIVIDEGGKADMCKAMREHDLKKEVEGAVKLARTLLGDNNQEVVKVVTHQYKVTPEYVSNIMNSVASTGVAARI